MAQQSRAEYFRKRRETRKQFAVLIEKKLLDELDQKLKDEGRTRADWLREKVNEELGK